MKVFKFFRARSALFFIVVTTVALISVGCSDSTGNSTNIINPVASDQTSSTVTGVVTTGETQGVGSIDTPIVTVPTGSDGITDHTNAPLLDNTHPGWQQTTCLSCHTDQSRIPDHSYADTSLCYLCHGTNGCPGFGDNIAPVIKGIVTSPTQNSVYITWTTDEACISRLILRTDAGDKLEFPVSSEYKQSHKYTVTGLLPSQTYGYEIIAIDKSNNKTTTATFGHLSFTTPAVVVSTGTGAGTDTGTGTDTDSFIQNFAASMIDYQSIKTSWTVKEAAKCQVYFYNSKAGATKIYPDTSGGGDAWYPAAASFEKTYQELLASTTYLIWIKAQDSSGVDHVTSKKSVTTPDIE